MDSHESEDEEVFMDSGPKSQDERKQTDAEEETLESQSEDDDEYLPSSVKKRVKTKKTSGGAAKAKSSEDNGPLSCSMCPILFKNPQSLRVHMCTKHRNRDKQISGTTGTKRKAPLESSKTMINPIAHFRAKYAKSDTSKEFACKTCGDPFSDGDLLAQHMTTHMMDTPSASATTAKEDTEEDTDEEEEAEEAQEEEEADEDEEADEEEDGHEEEAEEEVKEENGLTLKMRCGLCSKTFTNRTILVKHAKKHVKMHASVGSQACYYCGNVYTNITALKAHVQRHRSKELKSLPGKDENEKPPTTPALMLPCKQCPKEFSTIHNLLLHKKCHASKGPLNCPCCDTLLKNIDTLRSHLGKQHGRRIYNDKNIEIKKEPPSKPKDESNNDDDTDDDSQGSGTLACPYCGKLHSSISTLYAHVLKHKEKLEKENLKEKENTPVESDATSESEDNTKDNTKGPYECTTCDKICANSYLLKKHMTVHGASLPCPYCEKVYGIRGSLNSHLWRNHKDECKKNEMQKVSNNKHSCDKCSKVFASRSSLRFHKTTVHGKQHSFTCRHCKKLFKDASTLKAHMQTHRQELKIRISLTTKSVKLSATNEPYKLRAKIESNNVDKMETEEDSSTTLKCPKCPQTFTQRCNQLRHIKQHKNKGSHVCKICGLRFGNERALKVHQHHRQHTDTPQDTKLSPELPKESSSRVKKVVDKPASSKRKPFQCSRCSASYTDISGFKKHLKSHRRKGHISCPICGVRFNSERYLKTHTTKVHVPKEDNKNATTDNLTSPKIPKLEGVKTEKVKIEENIEEATSCKLYRCSRCPAYFNNKATAWRHIRRHDAKGAFPCPICGLRFPTQHSLNIHNTAHKYIRCVICYIKMEDEDELALHLKEIHKTSQSKALTLKVGALRKRKKRTDHVSGTSHTCPVCSKVLANAPSLRLHMAIHTSGPVKCPVCGSICKNNPSMYKHVLNFHKEVDLKELSKDNKPWLTVKDYKKFMSAKEEMKETSKNIEKAVELEKYSCDKCKFSCEEKDKIKRHMKRHIKRGHLKCDFCTKRFTNGIALKAHILTHNGINCILCNYTCSDEEQLAHHMRNVHKVFRKVKLEPNAIIVADAEEVVTAPSTKEGKSTESTKVADSLTVKETAFLCSHCNEMILGENTFERHMRRKHNIEHKISANVLSSHMVPIKLPKRPERKQEEIPKKPPTPTIFYCDICKEQFNDKDTRTKHIKEIHFGIKI